MKRGTRVKRRAKSKATRKIMGGTTIDENIENIQKCLNDKNQCSKLYVNLLQVRQRIMEYKQTYPNGDLPANLLNILHGITSMYSQESREYRLASTINEQFFPKTPEPEYSMGMVTPSPPQSPSASLDRSSDSDVLNGLSISSSNHSDSDVSHPNEPQLLSSNSKVGDYSDDEVLHGTLSDQPHIESGPFWEAGDAKYGPLDFSSSKTPVQERKVSLPRAFETRKRETHDERRNRILNDIIAELEPDHRRFGWLCIMLHDVRKNFNSPAPPSDYINLRDSFMDKGTRYNLIPMDEIRPPNSFNLFIVRHGSYAYLHDVTEKLKTNNLTYYDLAIYFYDTYKVYDKLDAAHRQVLEILRSLGRTLKFEKNKTPGLIPTDQDGDITQEKELLFNLERALRYIIDVENENSSRESAKSLLTKVINSARSTRKGGRRRMRKQIRKTMRKKKRSKRS